MKAVFNFVKKEIVFIVAGVLAIATAFVVHPSKAYIHYIDFRVLALLFSLMLVVAGIRKMGIFTKITEAIVDKVSNTRTLELILVFLCFFSSMIITNDVALITFVPFTIEVLALVNKKNHMIYIIVLQTVAANLGSMLTPIGNPQNIFLYTKYGMTFGDFFGTIFPYAIVSMIMLAILVCVLHNDRINVEKKIESEASVCIWKLILILIVFTSCIFCVGRVLDYRIMLAIAIVLFAIVDFRLFKNVDYMLLLTFVAFFIMTGNIRAMESVSRKLAEIIDGREVITSIVASQFVSNVPAAVLLSNFTKEGRLLLIGTNIGGLGTLIASMASLISFRYYGESKEANKGKYLLVFTGISIVFLVAMLLIFWIWRP